MVRSSIIRLRSQIQLRLVTLRYLAGKKHSGPNKGQDATQSYSHSEGKPCICDCFVCFRSYFVVRALQPKPLTFLQGKAVRTHWSRSRRGPCTLERVAGARSFSSGRGWDNFPGFSRRGLILYLCTDISVCLHP